MKLLRMALMFSAGGMLTYGMVQARTDLCVVAVFFLLIALHVGGPL